LQAGTSVKQAAMQLFSVRTAMSILGTLWKGTALCGFHVGQFCLRAAIGLVCVAFRLWLAVPQYGWWLLKLPWIGWQLSETSSMAFNLAVLCSRVAAALLFCCSLVLFAAVPVLAVGFVILLRRNVRRPRPTHHRTSNPNICAVCLSEIPVADRAVLHSNSGHPRHPTLCKRCLAQALKHALSSAGVSDSFTRCPASSSCPIRLTAKDLCRNAVPQALVERFERFQKQLDVGQTSCPNCAATVEYVLSAAQPYAQNNRLHEFALHCRSCQRGFTLQDSLSKELSSLLEKKKRAHAQVATRCPGCFEAIQKVSGCNMMHHVRCSTRFCYCCGERLLNTTVGHFPKGPYERCVNAAL